MKNPIVFIHGMFLTGKSWEKWMPLFEARGYACHAPSWPLHEGEPAQLRAHVPAGTGELSLDTLVNFYAAKTDALGERPILIGHSLGGLVAQLLVARNLADRAICIGSVAPNALLSFDWGFFKNSTAITNPLKGDQPFEMTEAGFKANFGNTMTEAESAAAYSCYAVHESRNVLRDAMGKAGHIDLGKPHVSLLFITAEKDEIIPGKLNKKNAEAYTDPGSVTDFKEFKGRGHFICGQPGWEEVASYCLNWLDAEKSGARL